MSTDTLHRNPSPCHGDIQENEERYRLLFETMTQGVVYQDADGRILSANPAAEHILGLTLEQMQGRTSMHPEWRAVLPDGNNLPGENHPAMRALRTGQPVLGFVQGVYNPLLGEYVWMKVDALPQFRPGEAKPWQVISIFSDTTGQVEAEKAALMAANESARSLETSTRMRRALLNVIEDQRKAEEAEKQLNRQLQSLLAAVQQLPAARSIQDIQHIIVRSARELTGSDGATVILREEGHSHYVDEDAIEPLWKGKRFPLHTCISGMAMLNREPVVIPDVLNDPRVPMEAYRPTFVKSIVMVPVGMEDPIAAIGNYWRDEHRPGGLEIRFLQTLADASGVAIRNVQLLEGLEQKVKERTADYEAANRELESFSYSVSHDLRAPLRAIDGFLRILVEEQGPRMDEEGHRLCGIISENTRRMGTLIDHLLAFSRTSKQEMELSRIDMEAMVKGLYIDVTTLESRQRIDFSLGEMPPALGDPDLIRQVWINLLSNAVKFSAQRAQPVIRVEGELRDGMVEYSIRDNGAGFDMKFADRLFGVFQRLHSQQDFEGTGVGLALVQRIIVRHGGTIRAEAEPDKGATFRFTLKEVQ
jgi:PAS domain S-box-containing protein